MTGKPFALLLSADSHADAAQALQMLNTGARTARAVQQLVLRSGKTLWVRNSAVALRSGGAAVRVGMLVEDIDEGKKAAAQLEHRATHDETTGLINRRQLETLLDRASRSAAEGDRAAVLCLGLDGFRLVNDTLGSSAGDRLLRDVGAAIAAALSSPDLLARLGGDEFAVLRIFNQPFRVGGHDLRIGVSIGSACWPTDGKSSGDLLQSANARCIRQNGWAGIGTPLFPPLCAKRPSPA